MQVYYSNMKKSPWMSYVYLVVIILLGLQTFISHMGDGPLLIPTNYWKEHGIFLLLFLTAFPRLTLLFSSIASGGLLWWLGWLFTPRLLVAILATDAYLQSNPFLVAAAWLVAFSGEFSEKEFMRRRSNNYFYYNAGNGQQYQDQQNKRVFENNNDSMKQNNDDVIDAEFKDLS